ncbi:uncharacterized protein LOC106532035 [Austrofundulus limnaeus]|uniref:Uncharacterized protein LOC106532035 n=1 Tax=Austrofundulus limnaeus TaxID=52670 RepID=A0A2I4CU08_AUSLI|nr:PREDICTED: uncharacterized protein LOC106532035 [Austrofundulus limnaeus]
MCWRCVRKRIKEKCISWGPEWLVENLPKPGHSNAIRLLEDDRSETFIWSTYSDPPLSPILVVSSEDRDQVYPFIHVEESQTGSGQAMAETPSSEPDTRTMLLEYASYRPQIATLVLLEEEVNNAEEDLTSATANAERDEHSDELEELLGDMDYSDLSQELTLNSIDGLLWSKSSETVVLNKVFFQERSAIKDDKEPIVVSLDLQQDCDRTLDTAHPCLSQCKTTQNDGYFPQVACLSTAMSNTER